MYITIDGADVRPVYLQVADEIKALIACGELQAGVSLPPVRQVAADLGVNLNTIAAAYRKLQKEGLVRVRHGSGVVVTSRTVDQRSESELRKPLRGALVHLALAGLSRREIAAIVNEEIEGLFRN
jgi:GntR family transcriptional regulator